MTYIWVNYNDLTVLPKPGIMVFLGKSSPNGPTFQVSDIIIYPDCSTMMKVIIDRCSNLVLVILWWILNL